MAYTPDYDTSDLTNAATDSVATFFVAIAGLAGILSLIVIVVWMYNRGKKAFK